MAEPVRPAQRCTHSNCWLRLNGKRDHTTIGSSFIRCARSLRLCVDLLLAAATGGRHAAISSNSASLGRSLMNVSINTWNGMQ